MDSILENLTDMNNTDRSMQFDGALCGITNEQLQQNNIMSPPESLTPTLYVSGEINCFHLSDSDDQVSNLNINQSENCGNMTVSSTNHSVSSLGEAINYDIIKELNIDTNLNPFIPQEITSECENIADEIPLEQKGAHNEQKGLTEDNSFEANSELQESLLFINGSPDILVPLSFVKTLMNGYQINAPQNEHVLVPKNSQNEISLNSKETDFCNSQIMIQAGSRNEPSSNEVLKDLRSFSLPSIYARKSRIKELANVEVENQDGLMMTKNGSMLLNNCKKLANDGNRKVVRNKKHYSRRTHKFTKHRLDEQKSSKPAENGNTMIEICKACGDTASSYVHYGGRSCQSCRAFFRRSIVKFSRYPGFSYFCKCSEKCFDKDPFFCDVTKYGMNRCKFCRFMRCKYSTGMVDNLVISAKLPAATEKKVDHNKSSSKRKTKNASLVQQCDPSNSQRKRLKYGISSEGNDKDQREIENKEDYEKSTFTQSNISGISHSPTGTNVLASEDGRDEGYVEKKKDEESCSLQKSKELMTMQQSSLLNSFHNIQSVISSLIQEQKLIKTRFDSLSEGRNIKL